MGFKQYLLEMPHWGIKGMKINSPDGMTIDGSNQDFHFDFAFEFLKDKTLQKDLMIQLSPLKSRYKGILPFYNAKSDILFLYDFDNNVPVSSNTNLDLLNKVRDSMKKHNNYKNKKVRIYDN